ncbi:MAG: DNA-binding heavy metal response regulator [Dehalococcoidia bacterium]|nr:DNA-binding heavy metal response regulator [Dehalococcoidia bacterium]
MDKYSTHGKRVLVVEDELGIAEVCARVLSAEGFQVEVAVNGEAALAVLRRNEYDLCLIDIRTPRMNGIELYQRWEIECPETVNKAIFTTGDVLSSNIKEFLEKTNRPFLAKPFTPDELRSIVRSVLVNNTFRATDQSSGGLVNASNRSS